MSGRDSSTILVTQPYMPPLDEFLPYLELIWQSKVLTNGGAMHQQFEAELARYLGVEHVALFNNGTTALITALQAMNLSGEVITTPFSFAATAHSILWNRLTPVFVDIDSMTFNIDARRIEEAVTSRTSAILPVHCYGRCCDVEYILHIADRHDLAVIYDAAHAFGVKCKGASLLVHGDLSVLSFHATKVFNTFEGGAIVCRDVETKRRIDRLKNFGICDDGSIEATGLNGKMNELQAAFGLLQLRHVNKALSRRRAIDSRYRQLLAEIDGIAIPPVDAATEGNGAYFPILVRPEHLVSRDELFGRLRERRIMARKYFSPLLSDLPMYRDVPSASAQNLPNARCVAKEVLCLPIHAGMSDIDVERVVEVIRG